jgi:transposase
VQKHHLFLSDTENHTRDAAVADVTTDSELCREFDISRKTGYKIFNRYKDCGLEGLTDRSRRLRL